MECRMQMMMNRTCRQGNMERISTCKLTQRMGVKMMIRVSGVKKRER